MLKILSFIWLQFLQIVNKKCILRTIVKKTQIFLENVISKIIFRIKNSNKVIHVFFFYDLKKFSKITHKLNRCIYYA